MRGSVALTPVIDTYVRARRLQGVTCDGLTVEGVEITELVRSAMRRDARLRRYFKETVAGELKRLGLISGARSYTEAGVRADDLLDRWLELGKGPFMRRHVSDVSWASAYLTGAGAAVLLIDDAYPALARFSAAARASSIDDQAFAIWLGPPDDGSAALEGIDLGGLTDALMGVDVAFSAIDASFDSAGGDGGGGDGGGLG